MGYQNRSRKQITLPSGATVIIGRINQWGFLEIVKDLGIANIEAVRKMAEPKEINDLDVDATLRNVGMMRKLIVKSTSLMRDGGQTYRIVDKPFADCGAGELSVDELESEDAIAIFNEAMKLAGLAAADGDAAKPFPEEGSAPNARSNSEAIRVPAVEPNGS